MSTSEHNEALEQLRAAVASEPDLGQVFARFLELVQLPSFVAQGEPMDASGLGPLIEAVAPSLGARGAKLSELRAVRLEPQRFTHGGFELDGQPGTFFLFDDPPRGMVSLHTSGDQMRYVRITLSEDDEEPGSN